MFRCASVCMRSSKTVSRAAFNLIFQALAIRFVCDAVIGSFNFQTPISCTALTFISLWKYIVAQVLPKFSIKFKFYWLRFENVQKL